MLHQTLREWLLQEELLVQAGPSRLGHHCFISQLISPLSCTYVLHRLTWLRTTSTRQWNLWSRGTGQRKPKWSQATTLVRCWIGCKIIMRPTIHLAYLKFVTSTTSGAGVKIFRPVSKKMWISVCWCKNHEFCVFRCQKVWNWCVFGVGWKWCWCQKNDKFQVCL